MNTCPPGEKLSAFLDGELPGRESAAIQAHIRACKPCADALAALCDLVRLTGTLREPDSLENVSVEEWNTTWTGISARVAQPARVGVAAKASSPAARQHTLLAALRRRIAWLAAAAACVALAAAAILLPGRTAPQSGEAAHECVIEEVEAGAGYSASVSYSEDGEATLITISPVSLQEAPANAPSGKHL